MLTLNGKRYEFFDKKKLYRPAIPSLLFMFHQHKEHKVSNASNSRNETCFTYTKWRHWTGTSDQTPASYSLQEQRIKRKGQLPGLSHWTPMKINTWHKHRLMTCTACQGFFSLNSTAEKGFQVCCNLRRSGFTSNTIPEFYNRGHIFRWDLCLVKHRWFNILIVFSHDDCFIRVFEYSLYDAGGNTWLHWRIYPFLGYRRFLPHTVCTGWLLNF